MSETLIGPAKHPDREIDRLYRERRKWAHKADGSGMKAVTAWAELERVEKQLAQVDADGDWRYEADRYDGNGWQVRR